MTTEPDPIILPCWNRRHFLTAAGCLAAGVIVPWRSAAAIPEPQAWGRVTELGEGVWAIASTPLEKRGVEAAEAAKRLSLGDELGSWVSFSPTYLQTAIGSWHQALAAGNGSG